MCVRVSSMMWWSVAVLVSVVDAHLLRKSITTLGAAAAVAGATTTTHDYHTHTVNTGAELEVGLGILGQFIPNVANHREYSNGHSNYQSSSGHRGLNEQGNYQVYEDDRHMSHTTSEQAQAIGNYVTGQQTQGVAGAAHNIAANNVFINQQNSGHGLNNVVVNQHHANKHGPNNILVEQQNQDYVESHAHTYD